MHDSNKKINRIKRFEKLSQSVSYGVYDSLELNTAQVISPVELKNIKPAPKKFTIEFHESNVLDMMNCVNDVAVLVFCSSKNPGGGVKNGSTAQEEDISLSSSWYFQVNQVNDFYLNKGDSAINSDKILFVQNGYLLTNKYGDTITPVNLSFIGSTAINKKGMEQQSTYIKEEQLEKIMDLRIENVLKVAQISKRKSLILGAWGCGVFGLDAEKISKLFAKKINESWYSGNIFFAINDPQVLNVFKQTFEQLGLIHNIKNLESNTLFKQ